jgi:hypothetical protein
VPTVEAAPTVDAAPGPMAVPLSGWPAPARPLLLRPQPRAGVRGVPGIKLESGATAVAPRTRTAVVPSAPQTKTAAGGAWRQWMVQLGAIREAVMSLPPIPTRVWLGGIVALLLVGALRINRSRRIVQAGRAAPPSVLRLVAEASRDLGLRHPPVTLMVDLAVSPMLWCGRRVRLVLPRPLWASLPTCGAAITGCAGSRWSSAGSTGGTLSCGGCAEDYGKRRTSVATRG